MWRRKRTWLFVVTVVLVLGAGLVTGRVWERRVEEAHAETIVQQIPAVPMVPAAHEGSREWFSDQLGLTADQQQKIDAIWAQMRPQMDGLESKRRSIHDDRDAKIQALLSDDQKTAYAKILADAQTAQDELMSQRQALMDSAEAQTRALLDDVQKKKLDQMQKNMHFHGHHGGPGDAGGPGGGPPSTRHSMTRPWDGDGDHP